MSKKIKEIILHKSINDVNFAKEVLTNLPKYLFSDESNGMGYIYTAIKRKANTSDKISSESLAIKIEDLMNKNKSSDEEINNTLSYMDSLLNVELDDNDESLSLIHI